MSVPAGARVSVILGKGGVGKTTVATAFAVDRAAAGERVLLTSLTSTDDLLERLRVEAKDVGLEDRLEVLELNPRDLVDQIVRKMTRLGAIGDFVTKQPGYESLVDIAPGVKEMAVFNLVWNKRSERGRDGRLRYDRIIVDGPATGHGLHWLEAPHKTAQILVGPLKERAEAIRGMLQDPAATEMIIVTLAEEMPVRESIELADVLRKERYPLDNVVINKWLPPVFDDEDAARVYERLRDDADLRQKIERSVAHRTRLNVDEWLRAVSVIRAQREEGVVYAGKLEALDAKLARVAFEPDPEGRLMRVAKALHAEVDA